MIMRPGLLRSLYVLLAGTLLTAIALTLTDTSRWVMFGLLTATFMISFYIMRNWMASIKMLIAQSDQLLLKKSSRSKWSFTNLHELKANQEMVAKKIETSVVLISNLVNPEKKQEQNVLAANDPIVIALEGIKSEMRKVKEEEDKRTWVTNGLAKFGEVLRKKSDLKEYTNNIISALVKYLGANQAGLFIEQQDEQGQRYLELAACYAYGRKKFVENRIEPGQGLLGQCMLEKDFIFIKDIPKNYVKITSGLGEATPRNIVVAPLIFNETFCGAIELASFEILVSHQLEFLKKVCDDIAAEIVSLKSAAHTQKLLNESNKLTAELQSQEEEMRQNLEELAATQEEMSRKQIELSGIINAIDSTLATVELDINGNIVKNNAIFEEFLSYNSHQLIGKPYTLLTGTEDEISWNKILNGSITSGDFRTVSKFGAEIWLSVTFTPVSDSNNKLIKILCMVQNITQRKSKEREFERLSLVADNTDNSVIITDKNGLIEYVNEGFTKMTGYSPSEVIGRKPGEMLQGPLTDKKTIAKLGEYIRAGIPIYEEVLNYNKKRESYWVSLAINPVRDEHGEINKFISIQANITETKSKALDFHQKMEALGRSNAIIELNKEGIIIAANENYLTLLGYTKEEMVGKPYSLLTQKEGTFKKVMDTIREQGLQSGTFSRFDRMGNRHCMKLMDYPVLNLDGELEKIIEFGVDVSKERRLEKEAERRQAELKSYLSGVNNTIASAEFQLDGTFFEGNEIFLKVMGYRKEDLVGTSIHELMGDDPSAVMMWENLKLGKFFSGEFKMKDEEGRELWLSGTFNPIMIEGDVPEKIIMLAQFTTQEKEKLNDLNTIVHALKATLPVLEFNPDFSCKTANEKAMKFFGLTRLNLKSKTILDFIAPYYHSIWKSKKDEIENNDLLTLHLPFIAGDASFNYEVTISVVRNLSGSIGKIVVLLVKESPVSVLAAV